MFLIFSCTLIEIRGGKKASHSALYLGMTVDCDLTMLKSWAGIKLGVAFGVGV